MGTDKTALSGEVKIKMGKNRKESSKTEVKPAENDTPHTDRSNSFLPDSDMGIRGMKHRHRNGEVSGNPVPLTKPVSAPAPAPLSASVSASVPVSPAPLPAPADYPWHTISIRKSEVPDRSDITLEAANLPGGPQKFDWISVIFQPLGALLAIVAFLVILRVSGSGMSMGLYMLIGGVTSVLGILWGVLRYRSQKQQAEDALKNNEQRYREYLQRKEKEIAASASDQRRIMNDEAPSAAECAGMNERSPLLWSRSFEDKSFMKLRLGTGAVSFFRKINVPSPKYMEDNPLTEEARKLAERYRILENLPVCCDLRRSFTLGLTGERKDVAEEAMALMTEAAALHSYEDLKIVLLYPESEGRIWEAARFLPHVYDNDGEQRYIAGNKTQALELLKDITAVIEKRQEASREYGYSSEEESRPHYLFVVADLSYLGGNSYGKMLCPEEEGLEISTIFLARKTNQLPPQCRMIAEIEGNRAEFYDKAQYNKAVAFSPEKLDPEQWYGFLSDVSPVRLENPTVAKGIPRSLTFFEAYGINSPEELRLEKRWKEGRPERSMSVRLGAGRGGDIISFDIHPNKAGAHGVFVGGTSSGKTTMIRSWVLSMAAAFSPETVSFVLVDFKEPGLLTGLRDLPHVVGTVGKLDVDIDRNLTALRSEISRRQRLFDAADTINIYDYLEKHYAHEKAAEEPVRFLYIVVDELNEFKMWSRDGAGNDWMSLLDQLYQTGSSLGIHIIAGSQTPGPFSQVMLSNARFRWCLRTNEPGDSKEMLGDARAFGLKTKGRGFISVAGESEEIQPIYADSPYYTPEEKKSMPEQSMALLSLDGDRRTIKLRKGTRPSELEIIVKNIVDFTKRQHIPVPEKIWPERLPEIISLAELQAPPEEELCAVVGLVDDPVLQSQYSLEIDLDKSGGFLIYGAAQTGKTTFLRTFAVSLLEHNSPEKLEMYIIENAAGEFEGFEAYPQVRGLCDSFSSSKTVQKITEILKKRRRSRRSSEDRQIVLLVDNLNGIMEDNRSDILDIVRNGPGQGVYLAASATRAGGAASVASVEDQMKTGFCFWISENAYDYRTPLHNNGVKTPPPKDIPGRGAASRGAVVSFQTAVAEVPVEQDNEKFAELIRKRAEIRWGKTAASRQEDEPAPEVGAVRIGYSAEDDEPVFHHFLKSPSLLVIGDDYNERLQVLLDIFAGLKDSLKEADCYGIDLDAEAWNAFSEMTFLNSGEELDRQLEKLRDELVERTRHPGTEYPPSVFVFDDLKECISRCSPISINRIDKNLLLNGGKYGIIVLAGCSNGDFEAGYAEERAVIARSSGSSQDIVPFTRAAVGQCLLLNAAPETLPQFFRDRYSLTEEGTYYTGGGKAEIISLEK